MAGTTTNNGWTYPTGTDLVGQGDVAIKTLADGIDTSTGNGLLSWTSYAPTLSNTWANGNGTWTAAYAKLGKTVFVRGKFVIGSTTTKGASAITVSLPVTASANAVTTTSNGPFYAICAGSATATTWGLLNSTTTLQLFALNAAGTYTVRANTSNTVPGTWATSDEIHFFFTYEAA